MVRDCLTIVATDGSVSVTRLAGEIELAFRVGDVIPDGSGGTWVIEEITIDSRCLVVFELDERHPYVLELLAA